MTNLQIQYFLTLAELKNFSHTANKFHVTQPVISKQIAALENELGFPLFLRKPHLVDLTAAGQVMLSFFQKSYSEFLKTVEEANRIHSRSISGISIYLLEYYDNSSIFKYMQEFQTGHPDVSYYIERQYYPCSADRLLNENWDIAFTFHEIVTDLENYRFHEIEATKDFLLISKRNPLAQKVGLSASDFVNQTFCYTSKEKSQQRDFSETIKGFRLESIGLGRCPKHAVSNMSSVLASVEVGNVFTIVENSIFPYIQFDYIAVELETTNSLGIAYRLTDTNDLLNQFMRGLIQHIYSEELSQN